MSTPTHWGKTNLGVSREEKDSRHWLLSSAHPQSSSPSLHPFIYLFILLPWLSPLSLSPFSLSFFPPSSSFVPLGPLPTTGFGMNSTANFTLTGERNSRGGGLGGRGACTSSPLPSPHPTPSRLTSPPAQQMLDMQYILGGGERIQAVSWPLALDPGLGGGGIFMCCNNFGFLWSPACVLGSTLVLTTTTTTQ